MIRKKVMEKLCNNFSKLLFLKKKYKFKDKYLRFRFDIIIIKINNNNNNESVVNNVFFSQCLLSVMLCE